jgi:predicted SAM-dependent methyltransferase
LLSSGADANLPSKEGWYAYHFAKNAKHAAVAKRLLQAHSGKEPVYDYAAAFLRKAEPKQLELYHQLFSAEAIARKNFVNVSAGHWRHPYWTNTEYTSDYYSYDRTLVDVPWDISLLKPVDLETDSIELAYCSHTTEHLTDEQDRHMFREVHRILKPGGVFRVTCPNVELYYQAYKRGDYHINQHYGATEPYGKDVNMGVYFVNEIASQLVQQLGDHIPLMRDVEEVERVLNAMPLEEACDYFCSRIDYDLHCKFPGNHINWWTHDKMCRELKAAGFSAAVVSIAGASISPVMRERNFFDTITPTCSLFVDAIK